MGFTPVNPAIKEKVLAAYKAGQGRNQIDRELRQQGIKVSHGSISNIIKRHEQSLQPQSSSKEPQKSQSQSSPSDADIPMNKTDGPSSGSKLLKQNLDFNDKPDRVTTSATETIAERQFKTNKDVSIENHTIRVLSAQVMQDFEQNGHPVDIGQKGLGSPLNWFINGYDSEVAEVVSKEKEMGPQINRDKNVKVNSAPQSPVFIKEAKYVRELEPEVKPSELRRMQQQNEEFIQDSMLKDDREIRNLLHHEGARPRPDVSVWTNFIQRINEEKFQIKHEQRVTDRRLSEWERRLEQKESNLKDREAEILEAEPYLPVARQLQDMKLVLEDNLPWIEAMKEAAQTQNLNFREAALYIAQELQLNRQFGGIQRQIEQAQGELKMLNITITQKQEVITTLLKLKQNGVKDDDIIGLNKMIDLSKMGREWTGPKTNLGQGNNGSDGNPSPQPNGSPSPQPGGNFSIWLNLLKSASSSA